MLTNTPKISPKTRGDIFEINLTKNYEKHDKSAVIEILQVFVTLSHYDCQSVLWNSAF